MIIQAIKKEFIASKYIKKIKIKKVFTLSGFLRRWTMYQFCVILTLVDNQEYVYSKHSSKSESVETMSNLIAQLKIDEKKTRRSK